jgi:LacI family transcriptional regulator
MTRLIKSFDVPVVDLGMDRPETRYPRVLPDNVAIGRLGAEYLTGRGFKNLVFYTHYYDTLATQQRMAGFKAAAEAAGANFRPLVWNERPEQTRNHSRLAWLAGKLADLPTPLAFMAINDHVAMEVLHACEIAQLRVPEQVVVLGVDNDPLVVDLTAIPISSIDSNRERIGYEAAALLDRLMDGEPPALEPVMIPPKGIITRKSTDILAVDHTGVSIAIHYIWEHFREQITVDDVAEQTMLSRRHLQDLFYQHIGHTIFEEITIQRLNYAKKLLETTDEKAYVVARQSGFGSAERMSKVFRRILNMGPRAYREKHRKLND